MAEISNSANEKIAAMAIAYDVALKSFGNQPAAVTRSSEFVEQFLERYARIYKAVLGEKVVNGDNR